MCVPSIIGAYERYYAPCPAYSQPFWRQSQTWRKWRPGIYHRRKTWFFPPIVRRPLRHRMELSCEAGKNNRFCLGSEGFRFICMSKVLGSMLTRPVRRLVRIEQYTWHTTTFNRHRRGPCCDERRKKLNRSGWESVATIVSCNDHRQWVCSPLFIVGELLWGQELIYDHAATQYRPFIMKMWQSCRGFAIYPPQSVALYILYDPSTSKKREKGHINA